MRARCARACARVRGMRGQGVGKCLRVWGWAPPWGYPWHRRLSDGYPMCENAERNESRPVHHKSLFRVGL